MKATVEMRNALPTLAQSAWLDVEREILPALRVSPFGVLTDPKDYVQSVVRDVLRKGAWAQSEGGLWWIMGRLNNRRLAVCARHKYGHTTVLHVHFSERPGAGRAEPGL